MFSTSCVRLNEPNEKLVLFCSGTLIRLATGFCTAFCNSSSAAVDASFPETPPFCASDEACFLPAESSCASIPCPKVSTANRHIREDTLTDDFLSSLSRILSSLRSIRRECISQMNLRHLSPVTVGSAFRLEHPVPV